MGCMEEYDDNTTVCPYCGYVKGTPAKEIYQLQPESILSGRYIIGKVLGFGGFGITYIAWDSVLEKKVAVKEYLPSDFATRMPGQTCVSVYEGEKEEQFKSGLRSFIEESQRLAKFNSVDGIVSIYDSFAENGTAYIIMEYLDGRTLKSILKEKGKIPYQEAIGYALPVLYALEDVHKAGIIHRDIAPDNIFITNDGKVKLLDFGAARYATTLHSKSLSVILKPGYAPEEQYRTRGNQGPWTDVYAMAATLYRAVTGVIPEDSLERKIPEVVGLTEDEALKKLRGFKITKSKCYSNTYKKGIVASQCVLGYDQSIEISVSVGRIDDNWNYSDTQPAENPDIKVECDGYNRRRSVYTDSFKKVIHYSEWSEWEIGTSANAGDLLFVGWDEHGHSEYLEFENKAVYKWRYCYPEVD